MEIGGKKGVGDYKVEPCDLTKGVCGIREYETYEESSLLGGERRQEVRISKQT